VKIRVLRSAVHDLEDGYRFYERQAAGTGRYFLDSLYSDIDSLVVNAGIHPVYFSQYHRLLSRRFPFAVYYQVADQTATVHAVLDCRRSPAWTRKRIG
jgi:plasmid stabilization system protein ParE